MLLFFLLMEAESNRIYTGYEPVALPLCYTICYTQVAVYCLRCCYYFFTVDLYIWSLSVCVIAILDSL